MLNRRRFNSSLAAACAGTAVGFPALVRSRNQRRPNILIITSDQERENVERELLKLPNRQRLEERGLRFLNAFCTTPQCSASRASLWTGLYPHQAGVVTNVDDSSLGKPLNPSIPNVGNQFSKAGYHTGYMGKWHLGNDADGIEAFGFQDHYATRSLKGDGLAEFASDWIKNRKDSVAPWLLVTSYNNPHDVYNIKNAMKYPIRDGVKLPENFRDTLKSKPLPQTWFLENDQGKVTLNWGEEEWLHYRSHYLHLIEKVDEHVGKMLDALEASGQLDNTVVVYTSDHGDMGGAHRSPFKGPCMYEELLHVPMLISHPEVHTKPVQTNALVSLVDLVPALSSYAGIEWDQPTPGSNLASLYDSPASKIHEAIFAEYYSKQHWVNPIRTIRTQRWKYNRYVEGWEELYDLQRDSGEMKNLAQNPFLKDVKDALADRLRDWQIRTNDPLTFPESS